MFEAAYIGDRGVQSETTRDFNATQLKYLSTTPIRVDVTNNYNGANLANPFAGLVPTAPGRNGTTIGRSALWTQYPQFTTVQVNTNQGYSFYHSMAFRINTRPRSSNAPPPGSL